MSGKPFRHDDGGSINRRKALRFRFDGKLYAGYEGDTLASALLANGVRLVGRSFKYHRPRGVFGIGVEEPSALIQLRGGNRTEPNVKATEIELFDGLEATSQNRWPSLRLDIGAAVNLASAVVPAGFYYKTFMWPASAWKLYEHFIRKAAGLGKSPTEPDPDSYSKSFQHCDVLIVGSGPAGISAALAAGRSGARVILVDEGFSPGGRLNYDRETIDGAPAKEWVGSSMRRLADMHNVKVMMRTTAVGYYDDDMVLALERVSDHLFQPAEGQDRQKLHWLRAKRVVLATGAIERSIAFHNNDRPGVMLASAARGYAHRFAVGVGRRAVIFTNNDSAYATVSALRECGVDVVALVDCRFGVAGEQARRHLGSTPYYEGQVIAKANGRAEVSSVNVARLGKDGSTADVENVLCDMVCVSGGWNPTLHLYSQAQGKLRYEESSASFVAESSRDGIILAGSANSAYSLRECLDQGRGAGKDAAGQAGFDVPDSLESPVVADEAQAPMMPLWKVPTGEKRRAKRFVDIQNDVTVEDVELANSEGYLSVEHLKRYTTLGMGTDQGRTSNVIGLAEMARLRRKPIESVGHTTFRPPYTPVGLGTIAADEHGVHMTPVRRTALHDWHVRHGADMQNSGVWQRAACYPQKGEQIWDSIMRETLHVRKHVGVLDVSTLGKIEIQGRDAAEFLERVYINRWTSLPERRCRYGLMLREDGFVFDDGTTTRISDTEFYMTTTTGNAASVMAHLEFHAQTVWPELHVHLTSVTDQWSAMAVAGPSSRAVLESVVDGAGVSNDDLPFMGLALGRIAGAEARIFRVSFSGELGFEVHMPSKHAVSVWEAILKAGEPWNIAPYGLEAMTVLRIEKGHVVASELNGRTTAADLGFGRMMKADKDFIGKRLAERVGLQESGRKQLVGLVSATSRPIPRGAHIVAHADAVPPGRTMGYVTSSCRHSPHMKKSIALALVADGSQLHGSMVHAASPLTGITVPVEVVHPVFFDPTGERTRG